MCGRFSLFAPKEDVEERFDARFEGSYERRYNAAPSQDLPVIRDAAPDRITSAEWGLQPEWAETRNDGGFINARAETVSDKRSFAPAMAGASARNEEASGGKEEATAGRCLVPADGYYEWADTADGRQPYRLRLPDDDLFAMAGLWTRWQPSERQAGLAEFDDASTEGPAVDTFAILTTEPNEAAGRVHDRMPVILSRDDERRWLDAGTGEAASIADTYDGAMEVYPVSSDVNNPAKDVPALVEPVEG